LFLEAVRGRPTTAGSKTPELDNAMLFHFSVVKGIDGLLVFGLPRTNSVY
jgi:hypothetical protein